MDDLLNALRAVPDNGQVPEMLWNCGPNADAYNRDRQVFNRRFQLRPTVIVFCENAAQIAHVIRVAARFDKEIRVRSGGHDHEAECSGTDTIVMDLRKMNAATVDKEAGVVRVQPGAIFMNLITVLEDNEVGIPHGTCQTVGIAGFTLGGGWGPWTRRHGMCCESLVGATIVLGNGQIVTTTDTAPPGTREHDFLWALRGGGGMSYGIVTEFVIKTFPLPSNRYKFEATWNDTPAIDVLELWERLIGPDQNENLVGTNLKIMAKPADDTPTEESVHDCTFYGYYAGTRDEIEAKLAEWFAELPPDPAKTRILSSDDPNHQLGFSAWDRVNKAHDEEEDSIMRVIR